MEELRICVIGSGRLGEVHARAWGKVPAARVVGVSDPIEARARALGNEIGCLWFTDTDQMLDVCADQEEANVASVAVPSAYHCACTLAAMDHGMHVICEKPMALTLEDGLALAQRGRDGYPALALGFCKRFMGQVHVVRDLVQSGRLGRPVLYRHFSGWEVRPKPWIMDKHLGGGPLFDIACHYVDQWRVIFGSDPVRVKASGLTIMTDSPDKPVETDPQVDTFTMNVEYASGDIGMYSTSWGLPKGVTSATIEDCLGTHGLLQIETERVTLIQRGGAEEVFEGLSTDMYVQQLVAFAEGIREGKAVAASAEDGMWALHTSLAALESIQTGEAVRVPRPGAS